MSNIEKLIQRLKSKPTDMREDEVDRILQDYGYERRTTSGTSHRKYMCQGRLPIVFPVHAGKVWRVYLTEIARRLGVLEEKE